VSSATDTSRHHPGQVTDGRAGAEAWVEAFREGWRAPESADAFADHFEPVLAPDVRLIQPQMPTTVGRDAFRHRFARPLFALIPDLHGEVERHAVGDDVAFIEFTLRGTLAGRPVSWRGVDRISLRDGRAVEREHYTDPLPVMLAVLTRPKAWRQFLGTRGGGLLHRLKRRQRR
jgi:ketosteroid isomerase-like protein